MCSIPVVAALDLRMGERLIDSYGAQLCVGHLELGSSLDDKKGRTDNVQRLNPLSWSSSLSIGRAVQATVLTF